MTLAGGFFSGFFRIFFGRRKEFEEPVLSKGLKVRRRLTLVEVVAAEELLLPLRVDLDGVFWKLILQGEVLPNFSRADQKMLNQGRINGPKYPPKVITVDSDHGRLSVNPLVWEVLAEVLQLLHLLVDHVGRQLRHRRHRECWRMHGHQQLLLVPQNLLQEVAGHLLELGDQAFLKTVKAVELVLTHMTSKKACSSRLVWNLLLRSFFSWLESPGIVATQIQFKRYLNRNFGLMKFNFRYRLGGIQSSRFAFRKLVLRIT